jgi:hypothetical protein
VAAVAAESAAAAIVDDVAGAGAGAPAVPGRVLASERRGPMNGRS